MNLRIYLIGLLIALVGFTACSDDADVNTGNTETPGLVDGEKMLNVTINLPGGEAVPYSDIATNDELVIDTVSAYAFTRDGGNFILSKVYHYSAQVDHQTQGILIVGSTIQLSMIVNSPESDIKLFFVANAAGIPSLLALTPTESGEADFLAALSTASFQGLKTVNNNTVAPLMMATDSVVVTSTTLRQPNPTVNGLEFKRVMARIDIMNREKTLAIDSVQFLNTPRQTLLFNKEVVPAGGGNPAAWNFAEDVNNTVRRGNIPTVRVQDNLRFPPRQVGSSTAAMDSVHMKGLFYPYEGSIADHSGTVSNTSVRIWGRLNPKPGTEDPTATTGTQVIYTLDLNNGNDDTANKGQLLRNHRYVLLIEDILSEEVNYTFQVNDWNMHDSADDTLQHTMNPEIILRHNGSVLSNLAPAKTGATTRIDVKSATEWDVTVQPIDDASGNWITVSAAQSYSDIGDYFTVTTMPNWNAERRALVTVRSKVDKINETAQFTVTQLSNNPLALFAKANLTTTSLGNGKYAMGDDIEDGTAAGLASNYGGLFQWGRNLAFANDGIDIPAENLSATTIDANNTTETKFIITNPWHNNNAASDTWYSISTYTNRQDPCPDGYRLPTANDWLTVIPPTAAAGTYATLTETVISTAVEYPSMNQITIETGPSSYIGTGSTGTAYNTVFGIKTYNGTKLAYRWRYYADDVTLASTSVTNGYLEIACVTLSDNSHTVTNVSNYSESYWDKAVVRYFPAAGRYNNSSGAAEYRGQDGYYWSSSANSALSGWYLYFFNGQANLTATHRSNGNPIRCMVSE